MFTLEEKVSNFLRELETYGYGTYRIEIDKEDLFQIEPCIYMDRSGHGYVDTEYIIHSFSLWDKDDNYIMDFCYSYQVTEWLENIMYPNIRNEQLDKLDIIESEYGFTTSD